MLNNALGLLLEHFARTSRYVPDTAQAVTNPDDLPARLLPFTQTDSPLATWRAWIETTRLWFVVGRLSLERYYPRDSLLLEISFLTCDGRLAAAGCWGLSPEGRWALRAFHDTEKVRIASQALAPLRVVAL
jgi:hypothetical protein